MVDLNSIKTLAQLEELTEGLEFEAKAAQGRAGDGSVPESVWETYSSFSNTSGGLILIGAEELPDRSLRIVGIGDCEKIRRDFISTLNGGKVSRNLLRDEHIQILRLEGKAVLAIAVPRAGRTDRPIYVGQNPLTGTYRRINEADIRCDPHIVKSMLADAIAEDRSAHVVDGYTLDDLESYTIERFRQRISLRSYGENALLAKSKGDFLRDIGAAVLDRDCNTIRPTIAGLIMFGQHAAIVERMPHYFLDYRRSEDAEPSSARYVERITWDGHWSGNLFDFFELVIPRLFAAGPNAFALNGEMQRVDENSIQLALREAFVNSLIHGDYEIPGGIVISQSADRFSFRNAGMMRIPVEQAVQGGISDCRNGKLQTMFRLAGFAEQLGSGVPQIIEAWGRRSWELPELQDSAQPDRTELTMRMADFLPGRLVEILRKVAPEYESMSREVKYTLGLALLEMRLTNRELHSRTAMHARDVTMMLANLVDRGFLKRNGRTAAAYYTMGPVLEELANQLDSVESGPEANKLFVPRAESNPSEKIMESGSNPKVDLDESVVNVVRDSTYAAQELVEEAILALCVTPQSVGDLAAALNRGNDRIRDIVRSLTDKKALRPIYEVPNHPRQRYRVSPKI